MKEILMAFDKKTRLFINSLNCMHLDHRYQEQLLELAINIFQLITMLMCLIQKQYIVQDFIFVLLLIMPVKFYMLGMLFGMLMQIHFKCIQLFSLCMMIVLLNLDKFLEHIEVLGNFLLDNINQLINQLHQKHLISLLHMFYLPVK